METYSVNDSYTHILFLIFSSLFLVILYMLLFCQRDFWKAPAAMDSLGMIIYFTFFSDFPHLIRNEVVYLNRYVRTKYCPHSIPGPVCLLQGRAWLQASRAWGGIVLSVRNAWHQSDRGLELSAVRLRGRTGPAPPPLPPQDVRQQRHPSPSLPGPLTAVPPPRCAGARAGVSCGSQQGACGQPAPSAPCSFTPPV